MMVFVFGRLTRRRRHCMNTENTISVLPTSCYSHKVSSRPVSAYVG